MADIRRSPEKAPGYARHRDAVSAVDALATVPQEHGINMDGHEWANIQIVPEGGANPTVAVSWWSAAAGVFIQEHVPISKAGVGVNVPFEFSIPANGRIMFVAVTAITAGTTSVYVSGHDVEKR